MNHLVLRITVNMFSWQLLILLFCFEHIFCLQKQLCYNDDDCFMNAVIDRVYPMFIAGMPGVEPSDPLRLEAIIADLPDLRYALYNSTLTGAKNCKFIQFSNKHLGVYNIFEYVLSCPQLTVQGDYELNGVIDSEPFEGKGACKIVYENYQIKISGKSDRVKDSEGKLHVNIIEYKVTKDLKGAVKEIKYKNLAEKHRSCDDRVKTVEKMTRDVTMDVFMKKYMQNLKKFQQHMSIDDLHFKYVR